MLESILAMLQTGLIFLVGLVLRALIAVAIIAAIALPIAGVLLAWKGMRRLGDGVTGLRRVGHLRWRHGNYYAPGHLWLRQLAGRVRVGLDDVAQRVLPEIDTITLPSPGTALRKGDVLGLIRSFSGTVALRAPVPGLVVAVNPAVQRTPSLLHADPYRRAWLVEMKTEGREYRSLPSGSGARAWLAREDDRLTEFFEHHLGIAAADGGELMVPPHRLLSPEQWTALTSAFLGDDGCAPPGIDDPRRI